MATLRERMLIALGFVEMRAADARGKGAWALQAFDADRGLWLGIRRFTSRDAADDAVRRLIRGGEGTQETLRIRRVPLRH